ncbi:hypothetical protein T484DRAFT_1899352, partial [Baffinella frigidus]
QYPGHRNWVRAVTYSCDGSLLASAGKDNTCKVRVRGALSRVRARLPPAGNLHGVCDGAPPAPRRGLAGPRARSRASAPPPRRVFRLTRVGVGGPDVIRKEAWLFCR